MPIKLTTISGDELFGRTSDVRDMPILRDEAEIMVGRKGKRSTEESERLIKEFIFTSRKPVTFLDICQHLGRKPGAHFRAMLDQMVKSGEVIKSSDYGAGPSIPRHLYRRAR